MIRYQIQAVSPEAHLFRVTVCIPSPDLKGQKFLLPAWIPGSYMIRDFARNIVTINAQCGDEDLALKKLDKQTWQCESCNGELTLVYDVYAWDLSVRSAHLDITHGYFNGTSVFVKILGQDSNPCEVEVLRPEGEGYSDWQIATTLAPSDTEFLKFGRYRAENYEDLIDHPVEMGTFSHASFSVSGVPHDIVITGRHTADMDRLCHDLQAICSQHIKFFGELPPMERYLFQIMAVGSGYGGLEHRSSTSLLCSRDDLPLVHEKEVSENYREFLGLCSHEYFHLWNVKRIRPEVFKKAGLTREVHTKLLWAFEGITSYYDDMGLVRSGCIKPESYLELLARLITRVHRGSGRLKQSVAESSFDTWTKFYKQDENAPNAIVSYYGKGALIALALDFTLRIETDGRASLDDLMRALWERYGKFDKGVAEGDIETLAEEVSGCNLKVFFDDYLRGTDDLPLADLFRSVGIGMAFRPARDRDDKGGTGDVKNGAMPSRPVLGATYATRNGDIKLISVLDGGAAQKAGLSAGDVLVAVDGLRVKQERLDKYLAGTPPGKQVSIQAFRRDELMEFMLEPEPAPSDTCDLWILPDMGEKVEGRRNRWLQYPPKIPE